jgi:hypothetical protein
MRDEGLLQEIMDTRASKTDINKGKPTPITAAADPKSIPPNPPVTDRAKNEPAPTLVAYKPDPAKDYDYYCKEVDLCWSKAIKGIVAMGFLLCEARMNLAPTEWRNLIEGHCPFDYTVACRLMQIAQSQRVTDEAIAKRLPPSWDKLYQLMKLEQGAFQYGLQSGVIHQRMTGKDITDLKDSWTKRQMRSPSAETVGTQISDPKSMSEEEDEPEAPGTGAAKAPPTAHIAIMLNQEAAVDKDEVGRLKDSVERLLKKSRFVGSVEVDVTA